MGERGLRERWAGGAARPRRVGPGAAAGPLEGGSGGAGAGGQLLRRGGSPRAYACSNEGVYSVALVFAMVSNSIKTIL